MSSTRREWYQLRDALESADLSTAASLVARGPSLIEQGNGVGESVLHFLAVENSLPAVQWLQAQGSDVNVTNAFVTPVLFEVAQLAHREVFLWLVSHGADPARTDSQGRGICEYLLEFDCIEMHEFVLPFLAPQGPTMTVQRTGASRHAEWRCGRARWLAPVADLCRSVKTISTIAVVTSVLVFSGCADKQADRLLGTWQSQLIPSEWGSNRITMTFFADGRTAGTNAFLEGKELAWHGSYRVQGSLIHRNIEGRFQEIGFRIDGDSMHMTIGSEDYTFTQVITEP